MTDALSADLSVPAPLASRVTPSFAGPTHSLLPAPFASPQPFPPWLLGNVHVPPSRPLVLVDFAKLSLAEKEGDACVSVVSLTDSAILKDIISPWPLVTAPTLTATIAPTPAAAKYMTTLIVAWVPSGDSVPTTIKELTLLPTAQVEEWYSPLPSGLPAQLSIDCPMDDFGISRVLKPKVAIGGSPVLCFCCIGRALEGQTYVKNEPVARVRVNMSIQIGL